MRLVRVGVRGYKRFARATEMNVDGRVIAIVGPNEAGKTSFLEAMTHLSARKELTPGEWTRGQKREPGRVVWARYLIEDEDRDELGGLDGASDARWYVVWKDADGGLFHEILPRDAIVRDRRPNTGARSPNACGTASAPAHRDR
jgi:hypothetical protein